MEIVSVVRCLPKEVYGGTAIMYFYECNDKGWAVLLQKIADSIW